MLPGDRLICAFVEPQMVGARFKAWLLHVTIVPWFRLADSSDVIAEGLKKALGTVQSFEAIADGGAMLGPNKNRPVQLLQQPTPFTDIEAKVRVYLHKKRAWLVDETTKRHRTFLPHVTDQHELGLRSGDRFWCERIYIVEQKGGYKEVVAGVNLDE